MIKSNYSAPTPPKHKKEKVEFRPPVVKEEDKETERPRERNTDSILEIGAKGEREVTWHIERFLPKILRAYRWDKKDYGRRYKNKRHWVQLDHVLLTNRGIILIETKNYRFGYLKMTKYDGWKWSKDRINWRPAFEDVGAQVAEHEALVMDNLALMGAKVIPVYSIICMAGNCGYEGDCGYPVLKPRSLCRYIKEELPVWHYTVRDWGIAMRWIKELRAAETYKTLDLPEESDVAV